MLFLVLFFLGADERLNVHQVFSNYACRRRTACVELLELPTTTSSGWRFAQKILDEAVASGESAKAEAAQLGALLKERKKEHRACEAKVRQPPHE